MTRQPFIGSGRQIESGLLATNKQDFNAHAQGSAFRHQANNIDVNPPLQGIGQTNLQTTLELLNSAIHSDGAGFISIGHADGYDGYAVGDYNVSETTTFKQAFENALVDSRLINGGIILILAGKYYINSTISVPTKISVIGEISGTYLIGQTTDDPLFIIKYSDSINLQSGIEAKFGSPGTRTTFENLSLFDNLEGSSATLTSSSMIAVEQGANILFKNIGFFGKVNSGSSLNRIKTISAISTTSGTVQQTHVSFDFCYFDGLRTPIIFDTKYGDNDFLNVTNSKIRFFGAEGLSYAPLTDCAIKSSLANIYISGNYICSDTNNSETLLTIDTSSNITSPKIICTNNFGTTRSLNGNIIDNQSGETNLQCIIANNNWNISNESSWYLTVGGSSGTNPVGDLFGENALDIALSWANSLNSELTIIVNSGTYTLNLSSTASSNISKTKIIGNKNGRNYPIIQLNINSVSIDSLSNKYFVIGNYIESLYFISLNEVQSVRPSFDVTSTSSQNSAHLLTVKDCIFNDTCLNIFDPGSTFEDQLTNDAIFQINLENCVFYQSNGYDNNLSLACPRSHNTTIKNCYFYGYGYAANIGTETYSTGTIHSSNLQLENCTFDLTNFSIVDPAPGILASSSFVIINDVLAKINLNNCQILADSQFNASSNVGGTIRDSGTFSKFIYIAGKDVIIENCVFNGPNQSFKSSSVDYALPCLQIYPYANLSIKNSKIYSGGLPLQIIGDLPTISSRGEIIIDGCSVQHVNSNNTQTVIDFDMLQSVSGNNFGQILITNSYIQSYNDSLPLPVKHSYITSSSNICQGFVQIYSKSIDVIITNNKIVGKIQTPSVLNYTQYAGLFVNNYDSSIGGSTKTVSTLISNNIVNVTSNNFSSLNTTHSSSACHLKTNQLSVTGNEFIMANDATLSLSVISCLNIDCRSINNSGYGIISNNYFSRNKTDGSETDLYGGYVNIMSSTNLRGQLTNNYFTNYTIDGSSTMVIGDNTSSVIYNWFTEKNINETSNLILRGNSGNVGFKLNSDTNYTSVGLIPGTTSSNVEFLYSSVGSITFNFNDTSVDQVGLWSIPLYGIVPSGAYITNVSVTVDVDANPTTTSVASLFLRNTTSSINTTQNPLTTAGATLTLTPTKNSMPAIASKDTVLELSMRVSSSTRIVFTAGEITITYRY